MQKTVFLGFILFLVILTNTFAFGADQCLEVFDVQTHQSQIQTDELSKEVATHLDRVIEFQFIRELAQRLGIRVWLFGGSASSFLHYVRWDLASKSGRMNLQRDRFDYDFTNIFRSTQDIDLVVDASAEVAKNFERTLMTRFPYFLGEKGINWEVRPLWHQKRVFWTSEDPEGLLEDLDFQLQNTDSHSVGMIEITVPKKEPVVRDLKNWNGPSSIFLQDAVDGKIQYFRSPLHWTTRRARLGENPEILSVLRVLVKAFQYELGFSEKTWRVIQEIVDEFDPKQPMTARAYKKVAGVARKLVIHASNIERAIDTLDQLGLRQKLIQLSKMSQETEFAGWLSREPLRSKPVGQNTSGRTAGELGLEVVAHDTNHFLSSESILRSHSGEPNAFISRPNFPGETAAYGPGFYTTAGRVSSLRTGLTIRFKVDPEAREGSDFIIFGQGIVIFKNKKALKVIPEAFSLTVDDLIQLGELDQEIVLDPSDRRLLERHLVGWNSGKILKELEGNEEKIIGFLDAIHHPKVFKVISVQTRLAVVRTLFEHFQELKFSLDDRDQLRFIRLTGRMVQSLKELEIYPKAEFESYLKRIIDSKDHSFELKKEAYLELLVLDPEMRLELGLLDHFSPQQAALLRQEVWSWFQSKDLRKKAFLLLLAQGLCDAIEKGQIHEQLIPLLNSGLFQLQQKNESGNSILQMASYYDQKSVLEWLIENPEFDFNTKNQQGLTEVEQLSLRGKTNWVEEIIRRRPEVQSGRPQIIERDLNQKNEDYPSGSPIVDFVKIEPGTFVVGSGKAQVFATLTQSFEVLSVDTTQKLYFSISDLMTHFLGSQYNSVHLGEDPLLRKDFFPIHGISYDEVNLWLKGLNQLSVLDRPEIQMKLAALLPGHKRGAYYDLPSETQWEMVSRLGGYASGNYSHGNIEGDLNQYSVYSNRGSIRLRPVGSKRPVFYQGQPIYDLHGLVWRWVHSLGSVQVLRGGSYLSGSSQVTSTSRTIFQGDLVHPCGGFRIIRSIQGE